MSTIGTALPSKTPNRSAPHCEECSIELRAVGGPVHPYWSCFYCGTTVPRSA